MELITVTGIAKRPSGEASELVRFDRRIAPDQIGDTTVTGHRARVVPNATTGAFSVGLYQGSYFYYPWNDCKSPLIINVTSTPSTQTIEDIVEAATITTTDLPVFFYTLATLRARTRHAELHGVMMGYGVTVGDGKAGLFYFSSASTATDDDALSCVKPTDIATAYPGRWLRLS
jgi:hypothetical protein